MTITAVVEVTGNVTVVETSAPSVPVVIELGQAGPAGPPGPAGPAGPGGPAGPEGSAGEGFNYTQSSAANVWTISHNLGTTPSVQAFNAGGVEILGAVQHMSPDVLTVTFVTPQSGYARIS
jgi:hypothetical protein